VPHGVFHYLKSLFLMENISRSQVEELLFSWTHSPHIRRHRADVIIARVRLVSVIFAVFTPLWIFVDAMTFSWPEWFILAILRVLSGLGFVALAWPYESQKSMGMAYLMLGIMLAIPPAFYLVSRPFLLDLQTNGWSAVMVNAYSLLPFVVVAGLSLFPLTALEVVILSVPAIGSAVLGAFQMGEFSLVYFANTMWLLLLVMGASLFSGVGQLNYLISLVNRAAIDALTESFTRRSGEEILDLQFRISARQDTPLMVMFMDLDNFKSINDGYGHEEGDRALKSMAHAIKIRMRRSDTLIRWGGEEFVLLLPNTDTAGFETVVERFRGENFGLRPDGAPLTASIGVAERKQDKIEDWPKLVDLADDRMYKAKKSGKNCVVIWEDRKIS